MLLTVTSSSGSGELLLFLIGVALTLRKLVQMDRYHVLRVIILTTIFSLIALCFANALWVDLEHSVDYLRSKEEPAFSYDNI